MRVTGGAILRVSHGEGRMEGRFGRIGALRRAECQFCTFKGYDVRKQVVTTRVAMGERTYLDPSATAGAAANVGCKVDIPLSFEAIAGVVVDVDAAVGVEGISNAFIGSLGETIGCEAGTCKVDATSLPLLKLSFPGAPRSNASDVGDLLGPGAGLSASCGRDGATEVASMFIRSSERGPTPVRSA